MLGFDENLLGRLRAVFEDAEVKFKIGDTVKTKDGRMGKVEGSRWSGRDTVLVSVAGRGTFDQDELELVR